MSILNIQKPSALNLELSGSYGCFSVGKTGSTPSTQVEYLLTHVGLNMTDGNDAQILKHLMPVRELFDIKSLDFEELMQRDIDDARVSSELIPYLLSDESADLVKLFPPIVVVVAPLQSHALRPARFYPTTNRIEETIGDYTYKITRSGSIGSEAYQLQRPILDGDTQNHDLVRLKLNTNKVGLVIVDGQHRAMALLAIFRNLRSDWSDANKTAFKDYYSQWPGKLINTYNLDRVSLPVMFCTFPELHEDSKPEYDVMKAARSVFLTLNKSARTVSTSRNRLLDDNDLVSSFLREILSDIKQGSETSKYNLRIHGVELDQANNRTKVSDPIALTGVNHIYQIIEHLFVGNPQLDVDRTQFKRTRRRDRTDLAINDEGMKRIDAIQKLTSDELIATTRSSFSPKVEDSLKGLFQKKIGQKIEYFFQVFSPFEVHSAASLSMSSELEAKGDLRVKPILFGGQSMLRTFEAHFHNIDRKVSEPTTNGVSADLRASREQLKATQQQLEKETENFRLDRANRFVSSIHDKHLMKNDGALASKIVSFIDDLYANLFTTVAFQTACVAFFFDSLSLADLEMKDDDISKEFVIYIDQLNEFFKPKSTSQFKKLVEIFKGKISGAPKDWDVTEKTPSTFRQVVYRAEMQPDQWPRYKALLTELWSPKDSALKNYVENEKERVRRQVLRQLSEFLTLEFSRKENKRPELVTDDEREAQIKQAAVYLSGYLKHILGEQAPNVEIVVGWANEKVENDLEEAD